MCIDKNLERSQTWACRKQKKVCQ